MTYGSYGKENIPGILTNDFESDIRDVVEFYNLSDGKERILDDMNNGFGWKHLPKSFMAENAVYLLMTALIRNFYKTIIRKLNVKDFGLSISVVLRLSFSISCCPLKFSVVRFAYPQCHLIGIADLVLSGKPLYPKSRSSLGGDSASATSFDQSLSGSSRKV